MTEAVDVSGRHVFDMNQLEILRLVADSRDIRGNWTGQLDVINDAENPVSERRIVFRFKFEVQK